MATTPLHSISDYGESDGKIRNYENPLEKVEDLKNAILFVDTLPEVDSEKIYMLGICAGAGHVIMAAAGNNKVKKIATVASWLHDSEGVELFYGGAEGVADKIAKSKAARVKYETSGEIEYVPKVSLTDPEAAMFGDFAYYLDSKRGLLPEWEPDKLLLCLGSPGYPIIPIPLQIRLPARY